MNKTLEEIEAEIEQLKLERDLVKIMDQSKLSQSLLAANAFKNSIFTAEYSVNEGIILWLQDSMAGDAMKLLAREAKAGIIYLEQKNVMITVLQGWLKFTFTSKSYAVGFVNKFGLNISLHRLQEQIVNTTEALNTMLKLEKDLDIGKYTKGSGGVSTEENQPAEEGPVS